MNTSGSTKLEHRPKGKGISATKDTTTARTTTRTTTRTTVQLNRAKLDAALKMYAENRSKGLIKISAKSRVTGRTLPAKGVPKQGAPKTAVNIADNPELNPGVVPADKPSKGSQSKRIQRTPLAQHSQLLREARRERLVQLSEHSRLARSPRSARLAPRKVSVCPITRSVASIEMNVPSGKQESSVVSTGSDDDRGNDRVSQPSRVQRTKVASALVPAPQVGQQPVETHRIARTDLCVSMISKNLVTDIVSVFGSLGVDKMPVDSLLQHLCADSSKPWSAYQDGKPIGARQLNRVLTKELGIHSYDIRAGVNRGPNSSKTVKGLHRRVFELLQVLLNISDTQHTQTQYVVDAYDP